MYFILIFKIKQYILIYFLTFSSLVLLAISKFLAKVSATIIGKTNEASAYSFV